MTKAVAPGPDDIHTRLAQLSTALGSAGQRVAEFIIQKPAAVLASSALEIATQTRTSDATVIRTVQALGYAGLADLKKALIDQFEQHASPADAMRNTLAGLGEDAMHALDSVLEAHVEALDALRSAPFREQLGRALPLLHEAARIVVFGIGPSASLAQYMALLLARSGRRSMTIDATGILLADQLLQLEQNDAVFAMAYGKSYKEVTALFREAQRLGLPIILVTDSPQMMRKGADVVLTIPRGRESRVALHGGTLVGLEVLILSLAAANSGVALTTLKRLDKLRAHINA